MRVVRLLAILAIFILGGALAWNWYSNERIVAEPMPVLSLEPLDGRADFAFEAVEGAYIVNVWGSWCAPCRAEHPVLMALRAEGYAIYGVNWRDTPEDANAFLDELGDPFVGVMRADDAAMTTLAISGAPETLVVGRDGNILVRWPGPITVEVLRNRIYPVLDREARRR